MKVDDFAIMFNLATKDKKAKEKRDKKLRKAYYKLTK